MTEQEAKEALFKLHFEYMTHTPKERLDLYEKYQEERAKIKQELMKFRKENFKNKTKTK